jgi:DnaJ-domain-containing protein 1
MGGIVPTMVSPNMPSEEEEDRLERAEKDCKHRGAQYKIQMENCNENLKSVQARKAAFEVQSKLAELQKVRIEQSLAVQKAKFEEQFAIQEAQANAALAIQGARLAEEAAMLEYQEALGELEMAKFELGEVAFGKEEAVLEAASALLDIVKTDAEKQEKALKKFQNKDEESK